MGLATLLSSVAQSFEMLLATRALAGMGASVIFPNVNATVGDAFAYRDRGRAISTIIAMNTMASIVGLPVAGIVAEATSWRGAVGLGGLRAVAAAFALLRRLPQRPPEGEPAGARTLYRQIAANASAVGSLLSSLF